MQDSNRDAADDFDLYEDNRLIDNNRERALSDSELVRDTTDAHSHYKDVR